MGFTNVEIMVPFTRTVEEAQQVVELLAANGLKRGVNGLRVIIFQRKHEAPPPSNTSIASLRLVET